MRYFTRLAVAAIIGLPLLTSAATAAELAAQAEALLLQVAQLQAQLGVSSGSTVTGQVTNTNSSACPNIGRTLKAGTSGDDVLRLQQFLARDVSVYPEGMTTGYYGSLTQTAVQRWQVKYNIVSSGTPESTGYGMVGPRTAAAIALLCSTGSVSGGATGGSQGPVGGFIQVSPVAGNTPLNVTIQATVNTTKSCAGAIYTLDYGDGTVPQSIPVPAGNCNQMQQTYVHTYLYGGTYKVKLSSGIHETSATVLAYGLGSPSPTPYTPSTPSLPNETFTASVTSGAAPLTVTFTGTVTGADKGWCPTGCSSTIVFGDGKTGLVPLPTSQSGYQSYSIQHTYEGGGDYTATLYQGQAGSGNPIVGNPIAIKVTGNSQLNPFSLIPNVGGNALAVRIDFETFSCTGYSVSWGDGQGSNEIPNCASGSANVRTSKSLSHTYSGNGSYTIQLKRGEQTDTASIVISN